MMQRRPLWHDTFSPPDAVGEPFAAGGRYDTVVVGAGLTGLALGVMLAGDGQRVAIVEARGIGAVASGHTTAKVSLLQGTVLSQITQRHGADVARAYVAANRAGQAWLLDFLTAHLVEFQTRAAYTYATSVSGEQAARLELEATQQAGLATQWSAAAELPYAVRGAVELADQAQVQPLAMLHALAAEFVRRSGRLFVGSRVHAVGSESPLQVETTGGHLQADRVVLATGAPVLDRGSRSTRLKAQRSYAIALQPTDAAAAPPSGMYLSADEPTRSVRTHPTAQGEYLVVGGNGHPVGRQSQPVREVEADLQAWGERHFPGYRASHVWSAQDYQPAGTLPLVGPISPLRSNVLGATGYHKWGMTNGVAAALRLRGVLAQDEPDWAGELHTASLNAGTAVELAKFSAETAGSATSGWLKLAGGGEPAEGEGTVRLQGGRPVAECVVDGTRHTVSAVCPHLGGVVRWNDAERSWDCPLHGSRFDATGALLEGPAVTDLEAVTTSG